MIIRLSARAIAGRNGNQALHVGADLEFMGQQWNADLFVFSVGARNHSHRLNSVLTQALLNADRLGDHNTPNFYA